VITALKAMTIWPAYQHFEEKTKGSIEVGKLADLVILSADPTAVDPETIDQIKVSETIKQGETVFAATDKELKKTELMTPSKIENRGLTELFRQAYVQKIFNAAHLVSDSGNPLDTRSPV
jgi:hypothetical protein